MERIVSTSRHESVVGLKFVYRPGDSPTSPLVLLIHGRAGNSGVMWTFERNIPPNCHVVSFEAFLPDQLGGWSWWDCDATARGSNKVDIVYAARKLKSAVDGFSGLMELQPKHILGLGFSQGGILISAATFLEMVPFDAIGVLASSLFLPSEPSAVTVSPQIFVTHGTLDETIPVQNARDGVEALRARGLNVEYVEEQVGHKVGIEGARALKRWLHMFAE